MTTLAAPKLPSRNIVSATSSMWLEHGTIAHAVSICIFRMAKQIRWKKREKMEHGYI